MFFKQPDLTSGSRPILQQDETLLFVQNGVGLYEGKYKIAACQNGHAYLTSHRACYIDDTDPRRNSLAIDLRDVERHEYQARFLRSSPKITLHPKPARNIFGPTVLHPATSSVGQRGSQSSPVTRNGSPFSPASIPRASPPTYTGNWTCTICTFNNPVPANFDPGNENFPLAPCLTCGIKPSFHVVLKAAIQATVHRSTVPFGQQVLQGGPRLTDVGHEEIGQDADGNVCPRCTFENDPSLQNCELCGSALPSSAFNRPDVNNRSDSPGPEISQLNLQDKDENVSVKFSFRIGGDRVFYERLRNAMIQRKWLTANAPPAPRPLDGILGSDPTLSGHSTPDRSSTPRPTVMRVGIAGLEQRGLQSRRINEAVLGTAFEDLEALMTSAREVVALAEKFSADSQEGSADPLLSESAAAVGMVATKDMLTDSTNKLYITELARNLAEYITDDRRAILKKQGGIMSLVDLWATFNRSRNGVELVSPSDFHKAAEMWVTLGLPVRLRAFKSGLLVVQQRDSTDEKTARQLKIWLETLSRKSVSPGGLDHERTTAQFGHGVTAQDAAQEFGWSLGVASEELEVAEERGVLCRDEGVQGLKFWLNYLIDDETVLS